MPDVDGGCQSQDQQCHPCVDNALPHLTHDRIAGLRLKSEALPQGALHRFAESSYSPRLALSPRAMRRRAGEVVWTRIRLTHPCALSEG